MEINDLPEYVLIELKPLLDILNETDSILFRVVPPKQILETLACNSVSNDPGDVIFCVFEDQFLTLDPDDRCISELCLAIDRVAIMFQTLLNENLGSNTYVSLYYFDAWVTTTWMQLRR